MILLSSIIRQFESAFLNKYQGRILPSQHKALAVMSSCRTSHSKRMLVRCSDCEQQTYVPHSCGHRNCPHCQHYESERWLERQLKKQVPADYYMLTFTIPAQLRALVWQHQRLMYTLMFQCIWNTLQTFSENDKSLKGTPGVIAVLHTHSRKLDFHPHIHVVMPAAAIDKQSRLWRKKQGHYLFNDKALAKVFRAKLLDAINNGDALSLPQSYPETWKVHCKAVGGGDKALIYLGRYLYRGVIQEKDIISCKNGMVTFRYLESKSGKWRIRTETGADFLWLVLQHVLPRGFRRARNYGFLHPNSKQLIQVLHLILGFDPALLLAHLKKRPQWLCKCCGAPMQVIATRLPSCVDILQPLPT